MRTAAIPVLNGEPKVGQKRNGESFCGERAVLVYRLVSAYTVVCICQMPRASEAQKAERINRARDLLPQIDQFSAAVEQLAKDCSISPRQAYRYLEQARRLKGPVSPGEAKLAFTVKLPNSLIERVRKYAVSKNYPSAR
jgi:hypothetical protein